MNRRSVIALGAGISLYPLVNADPAPRKGSGADTRAMLSAGDFGAIGDGEADDTEALQSALDAAFEAGGPGFLRIPPGKYKVTRTLRIALVGSPAADVVRHSGILAHGARIQSSINDGRSVFELTSRATVRFILIEGLDILGSGRDGHGILLECDTRDHYLYNFCLRDIVVQNCGGDGCRMIGNVFEGQIFNCYFRRNKFNGATFGHGPQGGILSSIHVFGCVFGDNGQYGVALVNRCFDVSFHGCYFLLNGKFGLWADNGCTLLSNCGFENNHQLASDFAHGDAGIWLQGFATLVGCTAYSIFAQTHLLHAYLTGKLVMVGCTGSGDGLANAASLARVGGSARKASASVVGCSGAIEYANGFEPVEIGGVRGGARFGAAWDSSNLMLLGEHYLWIDHKGRLRLKRGTPASDEDGTPVGA